MELRHLEYFITVAEEKSFSQAAKKLHMAQPPLSMQIKSLETELGVQLFERMSRGVILTTVGKSFLKEARDVLGRVEKAKANLKMAAAGVSGSISVGVVSTIINEKLALFLRKFRALYPHVALDIHEMPTPAQTAALLEDQLDLGFIRPPVPHPDLDHRFVSEESMILAVPSDDPLAKLDRVEWKLLDGRTVVLLDLPFASSFNTQFLTCCHHAGATPIVEQLAHSVHMNMWLVSAGFGVAPATHSLRYVMRPNLSFCNLPANAPKLQTVIAWKRTNHSPILNNMITVIRDILQTWKAPIK